MYNKKRFLSHREIVTTLHAKEPGPQKLFKLGVMKIIVITIIIIAVIC